MRIRPECAVAHRLLDDLRRSYKAEHLRLDLRSLVDELTKLIVQQLETIFEPVDLTCLPSGEHDLERLHTLSVRYALVSIIEHWRHVPEGRAQASIEPALLDARTDGA